MVHILKMQLITKNKISSRPCFRDKKRGKRKIIYRLLFSQTFIHCFFSDFIVSCDDVTGSVGNEVTFACRVSLQPNECCIQMYKFKYPNHSAICKEEFPLNPCEQRNSFTCRYTPTTAMTEQFRIFVQTTCGVKTTEFTVNIPGTV